MNQLFKKANLNSSFLIASEIIRVMSDNNPCDRLDELFYLYAQSHEEFMNYFLYENIQCIISPQKRTLLHSFIEHFFSCLISNEFYYFKDDYFDSPDEQLLSEFIEDKSLLFYDCSLDITSFTEESDQIEYEFEQEYEKDEPDTQSIENRARNLLDRMETTLLLNINKLTDSVFYLLYSNKNFLFKFNHFISSYITPSLLPSEIFDDHNHIRRCSSLPKWLQNGIIYCDRATCQHCGFDLSNSFRVLEVGKMHFDHIIPLEKGGTNDSTNFQLLCSECNLKKNDNLVLPDYHYQMYW